MRRIPRHLTYSNVMVTILAFIVLTGGTAVALDGTNTVHSGDIINDEVRSIDVRNDTLSQGGLGAGSSSTWVAAPPMTSRPSRSRRHPTPTGSAASSISGSPTSTRSTPSGARVGPSSWTPPKEHESEIRCYIRDPDGHLIEVARRPGPYRRRAARESPADGGAASRAKGGSAARRRGQVVQFAHSSARNLRATNPSHP